MLATKCVPSSLHTIGIKNGHAPGVLTFFSTLTTEAALRLPPFPHLWWPSWMPVVPSSVPPTKCVLRKDFFVRLERGGRTSLLLGRHAHYWLQSLFPCFETGSLNCTGLLSVLLNSYLFSCLSLPRYLNHRFTTRPVLLPRDLGWRKIGYWQFLSRA